MDLQDWIGKQQKQSDSMSPEMMQQFNVVMDVDPLEHTAGDPIPPCAHFFYFTPRTLASEMGADGHAKLGGFLPPVDLPRRMWAGGVVRIKSALKTAQPATKTSVIKNIEYKSGRSGQLCFVTVNHQIESAGVVCIDEDQHIVYREAHTGGPPTRTQPFSSSTDWTTQWTPDEIELFRFSAITFNGHRIHYDLPYTRDVEGYSGLVVHGPLMLHKMLQAFRNNHPGRCITSLSYRAVGPVICGETVNIVGSTQSDGANPYSGVSNTFIVGPEGNLAMQAEIHWEGA